MDKIEAAGLTLTAIAILATLLFTIQNNFPAFTSPKMGWRPVSTSESTGSEAALFMWSYRSLDLIAQVFILFGAAVGCLTILRQERGERRR